MKRATWIMAALALLLGSVDKAKAGSLAFGVPEAPVPYNSPPGVDGYTFTVGSSNIIVTALDYYVSPFNGSTLLDQHGVGIYAVSDQITPLVQTVVGPGTGAGLVGGPPIVGSFFASVPVAPTLLFAGQTYMLAGVETAADTENGGPDGSSGVPVPSITSAPGVTFDAYFYNYNTTLSYPTIPYPTAYVGPNMEFSVSTPEPASMTLLCLGIAGMAGYSWKKRQPVLAS